MLGPKEGQKHEEKQKLKWLNKSFPSVKGLYLYLSLCLYLIPIQTHGNL